MDKESRICKIQLSADAFSFSTPDRLRMSDKSSSLPGWENHTSIVGLHLGSRYHSRASSIVITSFHQHRYDSWQHSCHLLGTHRWRCGVPTVCPAFCLHHLIWIMSKVCKYHYTYFFQLKKKGPEGFKSCFQRSHSLRLNRVLSESIGSLW